MSQTQGGSKGKILCILSGSNDLALQNGKHVPTGFFLSETMKPIKKLIDAGYEIVFANPNGATPSMDPMSDSRIWFGYKQGQYSEAKELHSKLLQEYSTGGLRNPRLLSSFTDEELSAYKGLFLPGGHAPMIDLAHDTNCGRIINYFHSAAKPIGAICHGPAALLSAKDQSGNWPFAGYDMTCYSNKEEKVNEMLWWDKLPFLLESTLAGRGGHVRPGFPMTSTVRIDRELITGQQPSSFGEFADKFRERLESTSLQAH